MAPNRTSDRNFGWFFAALFAALGGWLLWTRSSWAAGSLVVAAILALLAAFVPGVLAPANRGWHALGLLLARIVNPIVLGILFFGVITPMGWLMRAFGKRPLSLEFEPQAATYWVERNPRGPAPASMKDPF